MQAPGRHGLASQSKRSDLVQKSTDHRHHRSGWRLPGRIPAGQRLRSPRRKAPRVVLQHGPHRPPVPGSARDRRADVPALRRPDGFHQHHSHHPGGAAGRDLQSRGAEPCRRVVRDARIHGECGCRWHIAGTRGHSPSRAGKKDPLLPGLDVRTLRQGRRDAAIGDDPVLPALAICRGQDLRLLDNRQLPRSLRPVRLQRHSLQPRVADSRRDLRHPARSPAHWPVSASDFRTASTSAT